MNKVLFGIFLGVLFNIPTFGMNNNLWQPGGNSLEASRNSRSLDEYYLKGEYNHEFDHWMYDLYYDYNIDTQYQNNVYYNNNIRYDQTHDMGNNNNSGDINYNSNNNDRNYFPYDINDMGFFVDNDSPFSFLKNMNNILPTSRKPNAEEFKNEHGYYFYGQAEQLAYEDIKHFCEEFAKLDECVKTELINDKDIKCGCCGGGLALEGLDDYGRQMVQCKNEKGCCLRSGRRELLELNLCNLLFMNDIWWKVTKEKFIIKLFLEGKTSTEIEGLLEPRVRNDGPGKRISAITIQQRISCIRKEYLDNKNEICQIIEQYIEKNAKKIQLDLAFSEILCGKGGNDHRYAWEKERILNFMKSKTVDEKELLAALNEVKTYYKTKKKPEKALEIFEKYVDLERYNFIQNYFDNN